MAERRDAPADHQAAAVLLRHAEQDGALQRVDERGAALALQLDAQAAGEVGHVELEPVRVGVEAVGQAPQQQRRRRAEDAEPEQLDVAGAGIVADRVDDRVGPRQRRPGFAIAVRPCWRLRRAEARDDGGGHGEGVRQRARTRKGGIVPSSVPSHRRHWHRWTDVLARGTRGPGWPTPSGVVVLTGAGISTDSGIPDFRGPNGVWTKNPEAEQTATLQHYLADPEVRRAAWQHRIDRRRGRREPNAGHRASSSSSGGASCTPLVTQNVDGLHQQAGHRPGAVVEVHGTMRRTSSAGTAATGGRWSETLDRVRAGEDDPPCLVCGGILKSATISFGQALVPEVIDGACRRLQEATCCSRSARRLQRLPGGQRRAPGQGGRRRGRHRQRRADRAWTPCRRGPARADRRAPPGDRRSRPRYRVADRPSLAPRACTGIRARREYPTRR